MARVLNVYPSVRTLVPTRALALLMIIGFTDMAATAWLYHRGLIVELNPIMRPLLISSTWLFAAVKGITLLCAWYVMVLYAKRNRRFVRIACLLGSALYLFVWTSWFLSSV